MHVFHKLLFRHTVICCAQCFFDRLHELGSKVAERHWSGSGRFRVRQFGSFHPFSLSYRGVLHSSSGFPLASASSPLSRPHFDICSARLCLASVFVRVTPSRSQTDGIRLKWSTTMKVYFCIRFSQYKFEMRPMSFVARLNLCACAQHKSSRAARAHLRAGHCRMIRETCLSRSLQYDVAA